MTQVPIPPLRSSYSTCMYKCQCKLHTLPSVVRRPGRLGETAHLVGIPVQGTLLFFLNSRGRTTCLRDTCDFDKGNFRMTGFNQFSVPKWAENRWVTGIPVPVPYMYTWGLQLIMPSYIFYNGKGPNSASDKKLLYSGISLYWNSPRWNWEPLWIGRQPFF